MDDAVRPGCGEVRVQTTIRGDEPAERYEQLHKLVEDHCPRCRTCSPGRCRSAPSWPSQPDPVGSSAPQGRTRHGPAPTLTDVRIELRAYAELVDLVAASELEVPFGQPRSVKDLVESVGIPHPEIGLLLVDGVAVDFDHRLTGGERVAVYPPFCELVPDADADLWHAPPEPCRFVLDVHLGTLARRLRLLGFDSWYRTDADDAELARVAVDEQRILLTRDRELLMRRVIQHGYCPRSDDPEEQAIEVVRRYGLAERRAPLTRCVRCNGELTPVDKADVLNELPPRTRRAFDTFARCPRCEQLYWPGSHVDALTTFLARVADESAMH